MKRYGRCLALVLPSAMLFAGISKALDWPQWQGPDRNAVSKERGLLKEWPKDGPPLAWKINGLGGGYSAPSIAAGRIFGMSNRGDEEVAWALSEKDGKEVWVTRLGSAFSQRMPQGKEGPACTPTVDGERLYVLGLAGDLTCLDARDGKIVWQRSLTRDFGGRIPIWSYRESPLIDGNKLICTPGGPQATLVALDKLTGKVIWKCKVADATGAAGGGGFGGGAGRFGRGRGGFGGFMPSDASYASAITIDFGGQRQYVQYTAKAVVGVSADGKFLWQFERPGHGINCSTPIYHDGLVFAAAAYGAGGELAKLSKDSNGGVTAEKVYSTPKMQNHHGGMILYKGYLYGANGGNEGGYLICLDFRTGKVQWDERAKPRRQAVGKGSVVMADGRIYYRQEDGTMILFEPSPKEYIERGRFEQPDRTEAPAWSHPVIANGKLYVRDQDVLLCYDVKAK